MEIPLNAQVECTDGVCGRSVYVLINPVIDQVTHLVVKEDSSPNTEYIVPVDFVAETIADTIRLRCSRAEHEKMDPFIKTTFIEKKVPDMSFGYGDGMYVMGSNYYMPYVTPGITVQLPVEHLQIPPGELAVRRGTRVEATDGYVGKVDEFVVNPENGHITHLVMREGHLWGQKDVIIPLSAMGDTRKDTVFLKLDKHQIESLPTFPVHRRWS
ncbi:MAG: PRC-barrel domain-containing protein [Planctomycetes bacterium]|nr:PRC-barrel domain-containing protein [Planctomycetota bacterium]